jgi:hypothetical protein
MGTCFKLLCPRRALNFCNFRYNEFAIRKKRNNNNIRVLEVLFYKFRFLYQIVITGIVVFVRMVFKVWRSEVLNFPEINFSEQNIIIIIIIIIILFCVM